MLEDFVNAAAVGFIIVLGVAGPLHDRWRMQPNRYQWRRFTRDPLNYQRVTRAHMPRAFSKGTR